MKYPQPDVGEERDDPFFYMKSAEKAFVEFLRQLTQEQARGFISEGENGKIFSFETYLRETGLEPDAIDGYCKYAKTHNLLEKAASKARGFGITFEKGFLKGLLLIAGIVFVVVLFVYIIVAFLLSVASISLWNVRDFLAFMGIGTVVGILFIFSKAFRKGRKDAQTGERLAPLMVVKYFDNDELTFAKAKSKLFAE